MIFLDFLTLACLAFLTLVAGYAFFAAAYVAAELLKGYER